MRCRDALTLPVASPVEAELGTAARDRHQCGGVPARDEALEEKGQPRPFLLRSWRPTAPHNRPGRPDSKSSSFANGVILGSSSLALKVSSAMGNKIAGEDGHRPVHALQAVLDLVKERGSACGASWMAKAFDATMVFCTRKELSPNAQRRLVLPETEGDDALLRQAGHAAAAVGPVPRLPQLEDEAGPGRVPAKRPKA